MQISHVALLVPSVLKAADHLRAFSFEIGPAETWEGEGTLEIYIGDRKTQSGTLLLMEAVQEGAYTRALRKRGPGLHHLAIDVADLDAFIASLSGSGWLLHPVSLKTIAATRTAWLARPGFPALIEVQERELIQEKPAFISRILIPALTPEHLKMLDALGLTQAAPSPDAALTLVMQNQTVRFDALL